MSYETGNVSKVVRCVMIAGLAGCAVTLPSQQQGLAVDVYKRQAGDSTKGGEAATALSANGAGGALLLPQAPAPLCTSFS